MNQAMNIISDKLPELPRFGWNLILTKDFEEINWYGRGPWENYVDRKSAAFVGKYESTVTNQYERYIRPQENGQKTDVRWMNLSGNFNKLNIIGNETFEFNVHHNMWIDFESPNRTDGRQVQGKGVIRRHENDIQLQNLTSLQIDYKAMGVGGDNSWGAKTHKKYMITNKNLSYSVTLYFSE
jgi:beta-galactosidase